MVHCLSKPFILQRSTPLPPFRIVLTSCSVLVFWRSECTTSPAHTNQYSELTAGSGGEGNELLNQRAARFFVININLCVALRLSLTANHTHTP